MITVLALAIIYKRALESQSQRDGQTKPADHGKGIGRAPTKDNDIENRNGTAT
ncbi:hypothetical protein L873DRAFT_1801520, partial [Choiromyces venosus 120613-1]